MKLPWFSYTNSGQLFCNCPLFVIAIVPGLFFGGKPAEMCCHSVVASKWLKTQSVCSAGRKYHNLTQTQIIKSLAVQRLNNIDLDKQCIHHFNLITYVVPVTMSILWITGFGKLMERPKGKKL